MCSEAFPPGDCVFVSPSRASLRSWVGPIGLFRVDRRVAIAVIIIGLLFIHRCSLPYCTDSFITDRVATDGFFAFSIQEHVTGTTVSAAPLEESGVVAGECGARVYPAKIAHHANTGWVAALDLWAKRH